MTYKSTFEVESTTSPGVTFRVRRVSFGRRLELARTLHDRLEAIARLALTEDGPSRAAQTALLAAEIDGVHLRWGVEAIDGLEIDGAPATVDSLIETGPEELVREILAAVRHETGLDEDERKNSEPPSTSCADEEPDRAMRGSAENVPATASMSRETAAASSLNSIGPATTESSGDGGILKASLNQSS
jgi:hypothetical protein